MQKSLSFSGVRAPFRSAHTASRRSQHRPAAHRAVAVAAVEEAAPEVNDAELKAMYKKFDKLIRTFTPNFQPGDKVGRRNVPLHVCLHPGPISGQGRVATV